jgi:hypothetical protein
VMFVSREESQSMPQNHGKALGRDDIRRPTEAMQSL